MRAKLCLALLLASVFLANSARVAPAAEVEQTLVYIEDMHCTDCAKKIASKLYTVPGVLGVRAVVDRGIAYVTPQQGKQPSPRALWEAVESVEFKPVKVAGPMGTFTSKPKR